MTTSPKRIVIIDDSEIILQRARRALQAEGYEVTATTQAVGNARLLPSTDLVIIDFHMPGIDGGTVIASLRSAAASRGTPCLFYLYTSDAGTAAKFARLGFDGSITDKGDEAALVRQVKAIFRIQQMRALAAKAKPSE